MPCNNKVFYTSMFFLLSSTMKSFIYLILVRSTFSFVEVFPLYLGDADVWEVKSDELGQVGHGSPLTGCVGQQDLQK